MFDYHVHTNVTFDAHSTVDEYCQKACQLGIDELCFTNHQEGNFYEGNFKLALTDKEWDHHFIEVEDARSRYPLELRVGVELGYYPGNEKKLRRFSERFPFDYVMGSVHSVNGDMISAPTINDVSLDVTIGISVEYFDLVKKAISSGLFDSIGHIDLVKRQIPSLPWEVYKDMLEECGELMKRYDVGFEVNTGGYRQATGESYPNSYGISLFASQGIDKITLGSDAHNATQLGHGFSEAMDLVLSCGYDSVCSYDKRVSTPKTIKTIPSC
ncbi:MAG: histidinol-phosphatase HisJ family protein [Candidatus Woesearchaeota archaeon]